MTLLGPFEVHAPLGRGAFGTVYAARHAVLTTRVAIKVADDPRWADALTHEIAAVGRLDHPHVVRIFDYGLLPDATLGAPGSPYLVMEACSGGTLADAVPSLTSWEAARRVLVALLDALAHAHAAGVLHRDIKLGNVLFATDEDQRPGLRVVDFGLSKLGGAARRGGTPLYMPPEQFDGAAALQGPWTDLYAVGVVAWRLVASNRPWGPRKTLPLLAAKVDGRLAPLAPRFPLPDGLESWLRHLLAPELEHRFASAAAALQALGRLTAPLAPAARPRPVAPPVSDAPSQAITELLGQTPRPRPPRPATTSAPSPAPRATLPSRPTLPAAWQPASALSATGAALLGLRDPSLTGRDATLQALWTQAQRARHAAGPTVLTVVGPEGAGRRAVAGWLVRQLHVDGGGLGAVLDELPAAPVELVTSVLGCTPAALPERLRRYGVDTPRTRAALELLAGEGWRGEAGVGLALSVLGALARRVPVTLALCDVDTDPALARLVQHDAGSGPLLFVQTTAAEGAGDADGAVTLAALSPETLHRLLAGWAPLHWRTAAAVVEAADGRPGRLVRSVRAASLRADPGGFLVEDPGAVPDTLAALVERDDDAATLLGLLGPSVPRAAVAGAKQQLGVDLLPTLIGAERAGLVQATSAGWCFRDPSHVDALARSSRTLPGALLSWCVDALDAAGSPDRAVELALRAGDAPRAVRLFTSRISWSRSVEQIEAFAGALASIPLEAELHGEVRLLLARNAVSQVHPDATRHLEALERLADEQGWALIAAHCVKLRHVRGERSIDEVVVALERVPASPTRDRFLVQNLIEQADPARLPGALTLARRLESRQLEEGVLSAMAYAEGDIDRAAAHALSRAAFIEPGSRAYVLVFAQHLLVEGEAYARALQVGEDAIAWCRLVQQPQALLVGLVNQAICHARLGDWERAGRTAGFALALPRQPVLTELCRMVHAIDAAKTGEGRPSPALCDEVAALTPAIERLGRQARWVLACFDEVRR